MQKHHQFYGDCPCGRNNILNTKSLVVHIQYKHYLDDEGTAFKCPIPNCNEQKSVIKGANNIKRHLLNNHFDDPKLDFLSNYNPLISLTDQEASARSTISAPVQSTISAPVQSNVNASTPIVNCDFSSGEYNRLAGLVVGLNFVPMSQTFDAIGDGTVGFLINFLKFLNFF